MNRKQIYPEFFQPIAFYTMIVLLVMMPGCDNFLDEVPDNRVALDDLNKAAQLLTNAYSDASYAFTDWMTDNVAYTRGVNLRTNHQETYSWSDETTDATELDILKPEAGHHSR